MMSSHFQEVILFTTSTKPTQQCRRTVTTGGPRLLQVQEKVVWENSSALELWD